MEDFTSKSPFFHDKGDFTALGHPDGTSDGRPPSLTRLAALSLYKGRFGSKEISARLNPSGSSGCGESLLVVEVGLGSVETILNTGEGLCKDVV
jgi:hypothetical protein